MRLLALILIYLVCGCTTSSTPPDENQPPPMTAADSKQPSEAAPDAITVTLSSPNLLFRFLKDGKMNIATSIDEVPDDQRHAVYVDDLDVSPTARKSTLYLHRFDFSVIDKTKTYAGTPVLRADVERLIRAQRPKPTPKKQAEGPSAKAVQSAKVVLYSTAWCGYCKKARKFLTERKVPFVEKDIEKSPAANQEMKSKAAKAGVRIGGVPVLDVNGRIIPGFDANAILQALDG